MLLEDIGRQGEGAAGFAVGVGSTGVVVEFQRMNDADSTGGAKEREGNARGGGYRVASCGTEGAQLGGRDKKHGLTIARSDTPFGGVVFAHSVITQLYGQEMGGAGGNRESARLTVMYGGVLMLGGCLGAEGSSVSGSGQERTYD